MGRRKGTWICKKCRRSNFPEVLRCRRCTRYKIAECKNCGHELFFGDGYGDDKEKKWRHFAFNPENRLKDEDGNFINCPADPCGRFIGRGHKMKKCGCPKPEPKVIY